MVQESIGPSHPGSAIAPIVETAGMGCLEQKGRSTLRPSRLAIAYSKYLEPVPSKIREADSDSKTDEYSTRLSLAPPLPHP